MARCVREHTTSYGTDTHTELLLLRVKVFQAYRPSILLSCNTALSLKHRLSNNSFLSHNTTRRSSTHPKTVTMKSTATLLLASAATAAAFTGSSPAARSSVVLQESQV